MAESRAQRLSRVVRLGLALGLGISAAALMVGAVTFLKFDCEGLQEAECQFDLELAHDLARIEALGAVGLGLLSAGLGLSLRRPKA